MVKYNDLTLGQIEAVVNRMGGVEIAHAFLRGEFSLIPIVSAAVGPTTFTVTGLGLTAKEWKKRLESGGYRLSDWAKKILSTSDYDEKHRLEAGKEYKIVLVRGSPEWMTIDPKVYASRELGEQAVSGLKCELALLIREKFSNAELKQIGLSHIVVPHEPIMDSEGGLMVVSSDRRHRSFVSARFIYPGSQCCDSVAFAFLAE